MTTKIVTNYEFIADRNDVVGDICTSFFIAEDKDEIVIRRNAMNEEIWDTLVERAKQYCAELS